MLNRQWNPATATKHPVQARALVLEVQRAAFALRPGRVGQLAAAGIGFFSGYLWAVCRWLNGMADGGFTLADGGALLSTSTAGGVVATLAYVCLVAALFCPERDEAKRRPAFSGVAPVLFLASCLLGTLGIQSILWVLA